MQNRLSLAELKAKANVLTNTEFITGGEESGCHPAGEIKPMPKELPNLVKPWPLN